MSQRPDDKAAEAGAKLAAGPTVAKCVQGRRGQVTECFLFGGIVRVCKAECCVRRLVGAEQIPGHLIISLSMPILLLLLPPLHYPTPVLQLVSG